MSLHTEIRRQIRAEIGLARRKRLAPGEWAELAGMEGRTEAQRVRVVSRLAGHLMKKGVDPGLVLRLLQSWDVSRHTDPLGLERVEEIVAWVADREASRLRGETT